MNRKYFSLLSAIQTYDEEGMVIQDSDNLKIVARLADAFPSPGKPPDPSLPLLWVYMFNKQEERRVGLVEEMKVNGIEVFNGFQSFLGGNTPPSILTARPIRRTTLSPS
ncbi:MAG: hypothetical protein GX838_05015 [Clostridiaceae bacterium]|nr:hypothetical protein [Clostridiaceae bacterium]